MLPPLLLHSPLRPLLATAGFLQLRLSLCVFFPPGPGLLGPYQGSWDPGCFPLPLEYIHSSLSVPPPWERASTGFCSWLLEMHWWIAAPRAFSAAQLQWQQAQAIGPH